MTDEFSKECEQLFRDWRELREDIRKLREQFEQRDIRIERLKDKIKMYQRLIIVERERDSMKKHIVDLQRQVRQLTEDRNFEREENNRREQQREEERRHEFWRMYTDRQTIDSQNRLLRLIETEMGGLAMADLQTAFNNYAAGGPLVNDEE